MGSDTRRERAREAALQLRYQMAQERVSARLFAAELRRLGEAAAKAYAARGTLTGVLSTDMDEHDARMLKIYDASVRPVMAAAGNRVASTIAKSAGHHVEIKDLEGELGRQTAEWVRVYGVRAVTEISRTTRRRLIATVARAVQEGLGQDATAARIMRIMGEETPRWRARMIARTEVHAAYQQGSLVGARSLSIPVLKVWAATSDERTREAHIAADNQRVGLKDKFNIGGAALAFPGDPSGPAAQIINCRCAMTYTEA